jgi:hypothetical protein
MGLERLSVAVRPRGGWESIDLGFSMARQWWRPLWQSWLALYLPAAVLLHVLLWEYPWVAMLVVWWLHPLFERAVMHVVSRAVFDTPPNLQQTLRTAREWRKPGLFAALTLYRADPARSLMLPVWQLEQQRGKAARARRKLLGKRLRGHAVWLTVVCGLFTYLFFEAFQLIPLLLEPTAPDSEFDWSDFLNDPGVIWTWQESACAVLAYSIVKPFYVCAGFALYLTRRSTLEGWDIEIALRKLAARFGHAAAVMVLAIGLGWSSPPAYAQQNDPAETIKQILDEADFQQYREIKRWKYIGKKEDEEEEEDWDFLDGLGEAIARVVQVLAWVAAAIAVFFLLRAAWRHLGWNREKIDAYVAPKTLFGLDLKPESLPDDVAAAAAALARAGQLREALSLLYRGALSALIHGKQVRLDEGDTEGDCLNAARDALAAGGMQYFARLIDAWCNTAYARRAPETVQVERLCGEWNAHFRAEGTAA